jgi:hypothetical protein
MNKCKYQNYSPYIFYILEPWHRAYTKAPSKYTKALKYLFIKPNKCSYDKHIHIALHYSNMHVYAILMEFTHQI